MSVHITIIDPAKLQLFESCKSLEESESKARKSGTSLEGIDLKAKVSYHWHDGRVIDKQIPIVSYGFDMNDMEESLKMIGLPTGTLEALFSRDIWGENDIREALGYTRKALDEVKKNKKVLSKPTRGAFVDPGSRFDHIYQLLSELIVHCELALVKKTKLLIIR